MTCELVNTDEATQEEIDKAKAEASDFLSDYAIDESQVSSSDRFKSSISNLVKDCDSYVVTDSNAVKGLMCVRDPFIIYPISPVSDACEDILLKTVKTVDFNSAYIGPLSADYIFPDFMYNSYNANVITYTSEYEGYVVVGDKPVGIEFIVKGVISSLRELNDAVNSVIYDCIGVEVDAQVTSVGTNSTIAINIPYTDACYSHIDEYTLVGVSAKDAVLSSVLGENTLVSKVKEELHNHMSITSIEVTDMTTGSLMYKTTETGTLSRPW